MNSDRVFCHSAFQITYFIVWRNGMNRSGMMTQVLRELSSRLHGRDDRRPELLFEIMVLLHLYGQVKALPETGDYGAIDCEEGCWVAHFLFSAACEVMADGRVATGTLQSIMSLPIGLRGRIWPYLIGDRENLIRLVTERECPLKVPTPEDLKALDVHATLDQVWADIVEFKNMGMSYGESLLSWDGDGRRARIESDARERGNRGYILPPGQRPNGGDLYGFGRGSSGCNGGFDDSVERIYPSLCDARNGQQPDNLCEALVGRGGNAVHDHSDGG